MKITIYDSILTQPLSEIEFLKNKYLLSGEFNYWMNYESASTFVSFLTETATRTYRLC